MASHYNSSHDLQSLSIGMPIKVVVKIKPNTGYYREDLKINSGKIALLDVNNRIREEFSCKDIVDASTPLLPFFQSSCLSLVNALIDGVNISVLGFGTTGSGKTHNIEGSSASPGFIHYFAESIFTALQDKKYRYHAEEGYSYSVKMRYIEVVEEEISDLLIQAKSKAIGNYELYHDEWEGNAVRNVSWAPCASSHHLVDIFQMAKRNRTISSGDYGEYHTKSTSILTVEVLQVSKTGGDTLVLASRLHLVDTPGMEKLSQDSESVRVKEGGNLNKAIYALADVVRTLSETSYDHTVYQKSVVTALMKDMIGGNCLTMAYFCLQNGDTIGSSLVLSYMRLMKNIVNFPVINDSRQIGLSQRYRLEIKYLVNQLWLLGPKSIESFNSKISDLEKELIDGNLDKLKYYDEKVKLADKIRDLKDSYNAALKAKADLEGELIRCEEERLVLTQQYIELQVEHSALQERLSGSNYEKSKKELMDENEVLASRMREDKAVAALNESQMKLKKSLEYQKDMEIECATLRINLKNITDMHQEEQKKNDKLNVEVINLINTNKVMSSDSDHLGKVKSNLSIEQERLLIDNERWKKQVNDLENALLASRSEIELLRKELTKYDMNSQRVRTEFDSQKVELEKQYLQIAKNRESNVNNRLFENEAKTKKILQENQNLSSDLQLLNSELKTAQRKILELEDNLREYKTHDTEMTKEVHRLSLQIEEMRGAFRGKLVSGMNAGGSPDEMSRVAREELIRTFNTKEVELTDRLNKELAKSSQSLKVIRGLRSYARSLKNLAEDWAPVGQILPEVLTLPPALLLDNDEMDPSSKLFKQEADRLRLRNQTLEQEVKMLQNQIISQNDPFNQNSARARGPGKEFELARGQSFDRDGREADLQQKLMNEIQYLKASSRPGTSDVESLRKERNELRDEVRRLHQEIRKSNGSQALQDEVQRLRKKVEGQAGEGNGGRNGGNQKMAYLEEVLRKLEKERSELSVRATMAEEQLKNLQDHMNNSIQNYQRKIAELNRTIQQLRG